MPRRRSKHNVVEGLRPLLTPITEVRPDPRNARTHSGRNIDAIAASLRKFGQRKPVVANRRDGSVLAGNGTLEAAAAEEWTDLAVLWVDDDPSTATGYALADNRTAELAEWDFQRLGGIIKSLQRADAALIIGWSQDELSPVLAADWTPREAPDAPADTHEGGHRYAVTLDQRSVIEDAIARVREHQRDEEMTEGQCLAFMSEEFIATATR
jgi:ParB-like chromosome segregation protein Spo0J